MIIKTRNNNSKSFGCTTITGLLLLNLLCFQIGRLSVGTTSFEDYSLLATTATNSKQQPNNDILSVPQGQAVNLPSVRVNSTNDNTVNRRIYGGKGDKTHLGGWTEIDIHGLSPIVWGKMVTDYGIKSIIDVGCGRGISTSWFTLNGLDTLCIEGSHDAVINSMLPSLEQTQQQLLVEHDFSRGPYWPLKTYDAIWCVEFLEHVGRNFHQNYLPTFRKAAIIFVTHAIWGGWHHVETHQQDWWIRKMELYGFRYQPEMSDELRKLANREPFVGRKTPNGKDPNPQNLYRLLVFINPAVAALPQHAHLMAEPGCFLKYDDGKLTTRECDDPKQESILPDNFKPLPVTEENQIKWEQHVRSFLK